MPVLPRLVTRTFLVVGLLAVVRWALISLTSRPTTTKRVASREIQRGSLVDRIRGEKNLDTHKYPFLQARMGRDDRPDMFDDEINTGVTVWWERYLRPSITNKDTADLDSQVVRAAIDELLSFNGWVAAACPQLQRPFGQNRRDDLYKDLAAQGHLYFIAIVVHSADHFLVDQLAVIVQLAKRLGHKNVFVSMLDSDSTDSTPTLSDLCEAVLTLLGIAFRIRRVPPMTADPSAAYYPLEEATARNLALDPLFELWDKRQIQFHRVVWLKGFTCPSDVLESLRVSKTNDAALVCGMDWAEHNGFFIFSDRWRTRDIDGNLFRQAKSNAKPEAGPPRDKAGTDRYAAHLPFQVFCCESGSHVVDPYQSYYKHITYRASNQAQNLSISSPVPETMDPDAPCMDSTQMWFCRDLWVDAAKGGLSANDRGGRRVSGDDMESDGMLAADEWDEESRAERKRRWMVEEVIGEEEKAFIEREAGGGAERAEERGAEARKMQKRAEEDTSEEDEAEEALQDDDEVEGDGDVDDDAVVNKPNVKAAPAPAAAKAPKVDALVPKVAAAKEDAAEDKDQPAAAAGGGPVFPKKDKQDANNKHDINAGTDVDNMADEVEAAAPPPLEDIEGKAGLGGSSNNAAGGSKAGAGAGGSKDSVGGSFGGHQAWDYLVPNSAFTPARILVNPRCVTTYGGVSHTALAKDLFGSGSDNDARGSKGRKKGSKLLETVASDGGDDTAQYKLDVWAGPPDSFVCQEMRTTGGRVAPKSQRRTSFLLANEIELE